MSTNTEWNANSTFIAQQDAEHVKKLTKAEMIEFYDRHIRPGSASRAKVSVHLVAQASAENKEKMADLLKGLNLDKADETKVKAALLRPELRNDTENLKLYLTNEVKLGEDKVATVMAAAHDPKTGPKVNGAENGEDGEAKTDGADGKKKGGEPTLITDVRSFRASMQATAGARPHGDLSMYEDLDAKL